MARRLVWPTGDDDRPWWRERLERWHELTGDEKLEVMKAWCEDQDGRQAVTDVFLAAFRKLLWLLLGAFVVIATQTLWSRYQVIRTGQVVIPAPSGGRLFPDRADPPAPAGH